MDGMLEKTKRRNAVKNFTAHKLNKHKSMYKVLITHAEYFVNENKSNKVYHFNLNSLTLGSVRPSIL